MPRRLHICALCALLVSLATTLGCSSVGPRKYVFFGDPKPEKVEIFEDLWSDEYGAFKPDDPSLPLRRGKAGVVRFFKKNSYSRSILVDGTLTVNVYEGDKPGITLTQPDAQMVLTSEELNENHRQFDKKTGYTYHIWLDLGEYDQPEKTYTILSIFKDGKTGEATLSKPIIIVAPGTSPEIKDDEEETTASDGASAAEEWAREALGDDVENPIAELQKRYSVRGAKKRADEEAKGKTRLRESIPVEPSRLRSDKADDDYDVLDYSELDDENNRRAGSTASLLEKTEAKSERRREELLAQLDERTAYHRERRRQNLERVENGDLDARARFDQSETLRAGQDAADALNFRDARPDYRSQTENFASEMTNRAARLSEQAAEQYAKGPENGPRSNAPSTLGNDAAREPAQVAFADEVAARLPVAPTKPTTAPHAFDDGLGDFQPDSDAPPTEVRVGRPPARY
ncbi:MAG: hypothetical protein IKK39_10615 [Thermoguttaceae bacterium]|nr:hypothetical protein [Thermoguttaceae bacterium]MBR4104498.1 hypothetical protein [Thermoguttaceae bacterium]